MREKVINFSEIQKKENQINIGLQVDSPFEDVEDVLSLLSNYAGRGWTVRTVESIGEEEQEGPDGEKFTVARFNFIANLGVAYVCSHRGKIINCIAIEIEGKKDGSYQSSIKSPQGGELGVNGNDNRRTFIEGIWENR